MRPALLQLTLAGLLCVAALGGYAVWYATVSAKSTAVASLERQINVKMNTASTMASARASIAEIAGDEASIQAYFVSDEQVVPFINDLEALGEKAGATVTVLSVTPGSGTGRKTIAFSLSVAGTFDAVMRTIGAIEYAPYDLTISSLSVVHEAKHWRADVNLVAGSPSQAAATKTP